MALNVTTAVFGEGCNTATASPSLAQWDQGQVLKIEGVDLPSAYQVEFSTEYTRNAIPRIGNADGVAIPNELLQRSAPITAYIVLHEGESDRETEYWITIHITPRTPPETVTPDPEQMDVIDETIAALQDGVAAAEAAAQSVQNMGVEAETLTPGSPLTVTKEVDPETEAVTLIFGLTQGPKGDNGYSPTITITTITGGHRFTVTDKTHPSGQSFDVLDGAKGDPGDEGYSPVVTITTITGGHRFTVTDKTHPSGQSFDVLDGAKGDPGDEGYSPVVTITTITGGHRVTITDKTHPSGQTFDVMDGVIQSVNGKSAASITLDAGDIEFDDSETYQNGSTGAKLSALKNALNDLDDVADDVPLITGKLLHVKSANVYDKGSATAGYLDLSGNVVVDSNSMTSDFIAVTPGDIVKTYYVASDVVYAANMATICGYSADKTFVSGTRSTYVNTYTIPNGVAFIRFNIGNNMVDTYMLIVNGTQPTTYIPYQNFYVATPDFIDSAVGSYGFATVPISKEETDFWEEEKSANLYNSQDAVLNEFFNPNGIIQSNQNVARAYVLLDGAGTYSLKVNGLFFGLSNALKIPCFDNNKNYIKFITAETDDTTATDENLCTLTVSDADISEGVAFIGFTMGITFYETEMVVKGENYPDSYIPYYQYWTIPDLVSVSKNPLFGKEIVFDGDSICAGLGSAMGDYGNGWAGRIGVDYGANAINVGVSGACITAETYYSGGAPRHWVSRYIDTIHANYPDADYIIAEGGTNDADNFYGDASKLGTFDEADFTGPFDDTTFYGAMDSWCKKALSYYPKAKVGFIVAQKMGLGFVTYTKNRYDYFTYASKVCKKWGVPVLNLWDEGQLRPDVVTMYDPQYNTIETATEHGLPYYDGQHLTAYGYDVISHKIAEWMKTL